jgi:hypothetical protein
MFWKLVVKASESRRSWRRSGAMDEFAEPEAGPIADFLVLARVGDHDQDSVRFAQGSPSYAVIG